MDWPVFDDVSAVPCCCFHYALCVFLPTLAPVTVTLAATTNLRRRRCRFFLPPTSTFDNVIGKLLGGADTTEMKSAGRPATISHILACIPRSIVRVYPSVSPHMGLFLATGNCVVLCFCTGAGVGLSRRASRGEKHSAWYG